MKSPVPVVMSYSGSSTPKRFDGDDPQRCVPLDRHPVDDPLARDRGVHGVKEAQVLPKAAQQPHDCRALGIDRQAALDGEGEPESPKAGCDLVDDGRGRCCRCVGSHRAVAAFGVEDPAQESLAPFIDGARGQPMMPSTEATPARVEVRIAVIALTLSDGLLEGELIRRDLELGQIRAGSANCLEVHEGQAEPVDLPTTPAEPRIGRSRRARRRGSSRRGSHVDSPARRRAVPRTVPVPISLLFRVRCGRRSRPCSVPLTCFHPRSCQEPVVAAGHQLRSVLQGDPVGGLHRRPVVEHVAWSRSRRYAPSRTVP